MRRADPRRAGGGGGAALLLIVLVAILLLTLSVNVCAEDSAWSAYDRFVEELPRDVAEVLPKTLDGAGDSLVDAVSPSAIAARIGEEMRTKMGDVLSLAATLTGILVLSALLSSVRDAFGAPSLEGVAALCPSAIMAGVLLTLTANMTVAVTDFLDRLGVLIGAMIPFAGTLLAVGGNVGTAAVSSAGFGLLLAVVEQLCAGTLAPVTGMCAVLSVSGALFGGDFRGTVNGIKKIYTFFLGLVATVLTFSLSVQTSLAAGADGLAMKSVRMLAGRAIPVVGGSVGETLRTAAGSIGYLRSVAGGVGLLAVFVILVPPLVSMVGYRLILIAARSVADLLGTASESKMLEAVETVFGYMLAVMCVCAVTSLLLITLFAKCAVAME